MSICHKLPFWQVLPSLQIWSHCFLGHLYKQGPAFGCMASSMMHAGDSGLQVQVGFKCYISGSYCASVNTWSIRNGFIPLPQIYALTQFQSKREVSWTSQLGFWFVNYKTIYAHVQYCICAFFIVYQVQSVAIATGGLKSKSKNITILLKQTANLSSVWSARAIYLNTYITENCQF